MAEIATGNSSKQELESVLLVQKQKELKLTKNIIILRYVIAFFLCCLISGLGAASYLLLYNNEVNTFQDQYNSATLQITNAISTG
jgi:hypothetical protein